MFAANLVCSAFCNAVRASRRPLLKVRVSRFVEGFTHLALDVELRLEIDGSSNERPGAPFAANNSNSGMIFEGDRIMRRSERRRAVALKSTRLVVAGPELRSLEVNKLKKLFLRFKRELQLYRNIFLADQGTPKLTKWLRGSAVAYAATPLDIVPDFSPAVGHLDDAVVIPTFFYLALKTIPKFFLDERAAEMIACARRRVSPTSEVLS